MFRIAASLLGRQLIDYIASFAIVVTVFAASMLAFFCAALAYYGIKRILGVDDDT